MNTPVTPAPNLPKIVKQSATYKLIVPEKVEEKIRYLIRKYPSTEWSGVLFYTYSGSFENNDLIITCQDLFPMDLGTSTNTEFRMSAEVSRYIASNLELFDCQTGLIHSHHQLGAFFSATDITTLQTEGNDTNCFVSLVVDTKGTYVAAITRKVKSKRTVTVTDSKASYGFFGEGNKQLDSKGDLTKEIETEEIQYFILGVERHEVSNPLDFLDQRFNEIVEQKTALTKHASPSNTLFSSSSFNDCALPWLKEQQSTYIEQQNPYMEDPQTFYDSEDYVEPAYIPDPALIHAAVCRMVMCSLTLNVEKFDLKQWIKRYMNQVYERTFPNNATFHEWADYAVSFYVYNFVDHSAPKDLPDELYFGQVIEAMIRELSPFKSDKTPYIQKYIDTLQTYLT